MCVFVSLLLTNQWADRVKTSYECYSQYTQDTHSPAVLFQTNIRGSTLVCRLHSLMPCGNTVMQILQGYPRLVFTIAILMYLVFNVFPGLKDY